jgi:hypothetical protein
MIALLAFLGILHLPTKKALPNSRQAAMSLLSHAEERNETASLAPFCLLRIALEKQDAEYPFSQSIINAFAN